MDSIIIRKTNSELSSDESREKMTFESVSLSKVSIDVLLKSSTLAHFIANLIRSGSADVCENIASCMQSYFYIYLLDNDLI